MKGKHPAHHYLTGCLWSSDEWALRAAGQRLVGQAKPQIYAKGRAEQVPQRVEGCGWARLSEEHLSDGYPPRPTS